MTVPSGMIRAVLSVVCIIRVMLPMDCLCIGVIYVAVHTSGSFPKQMAKTEKDMANLLGTKKK